MVLLTLTSTNEPAMHAASTDARSAPSLPIAIRDVAIPAEDGRALAATLFEPSGKASVSAPLVGIAAGASVPRRFYARFATYLAERGSIALTFDYRDVAGSRAGPLAGSATRMRDWCLLDVAGVLTWASRTYPGRSIYWVGHSMGGFATGLAHNNHLIARQLNVTTLSGYWGRMAVPERYRVLILMGGLAPLIIRFAGYMPGRIMGGEDMPPQAFLEWRRWCMHPEFLFSDPALPEQANFAKLRAPMRFIQIADDPWGTPGNVGHMASHFTGSTDRALWPMSPAQGGVAKIGHFGFFRPELRDTLWREAVDWLLAG
jgi:predicted alpha/beta hydrolase